MNSLRAMRRSLASVGTVALALLLFVAGCGSPSETVRVTDRPDRPTEDRELQPRQEPRIAMPEGYDTVRVQTQDQGAMWTFDNLPLDRFAERYDFEPDETWVEQVTTGAVRFGDNCSASFVSPHGLLMTNHHCAREAIGQVSPSGESLLEDGYVARDLDEERLVPDLTVKQFVEVEDVTDQVRDDTRDQGRRGRATRAEDRDRRANELEEELNEEAQQEDERLHVEVTAQNQGGRYAAYTFRAYEDVRLALAPEMQLGFFGGSPDNFTYPRYNLDVAFFRVYDDNGDPLEPSTHFSWSTEGAAAGDPVFAVGNPGTTQRQQAVSQLKFERDHNVPQQLDALRNRQDIIGEFVEGRLEAVDYPELQNLFFAIENSVKSTEGQLRGLRDPYLIARRTAHERQLQTVILSSDSLRAQYRDVLRELEQLQRAKEGTLRRGAAFTFFTNPELGSRVFTRAIYGYYYDNLQRQRAPSEELDRIREEAMALRDWPTEVETAFVALRLKEMQDALGSGDPTVRRILDEKTPEERAEQLVEESALSDSSSFAQVFDDGYLGSDDPSLPIIEAIAPVYFSHIEQRENFRNSERTLVAELSRARAAAFDTPMPPDASFTPRLSDGVVRGYTSNGGTTAPFTNFYGLLDRHFSHQDVAWDLPEEWQDPPTDFDLSTPLNMVSTNDIAGGSSGSPLLDEELNVVGVVFDSNLEALPNRYLYTDQFARAVSVDARGILEALEVMYEADHLVEELQTEQLAVPAAAQAAPDDS